LKLSRGVSYYASVPGFVTGVLRKIFVCIATRNFFSNLRNTSLPRSVEPHASHFRLALLNEDFPMDNRMLTLALAGSLATVIAAAATPASAQDAGKEKCYGVAMKGQNDCAAGNHACAGHSKTDYDKASFKLVPTGTCVKMKTPQGMGSLKPGKA
jgi:uncharacterized membrane protein